jgi:tetratricopeptide (TPR) repeat protein/nucleoside phosphorylase
MTKHLVDVLIITAADGEDDAVRLVDDGALGEWVEGPDDAHRFTIWRRSYITANGRTLRVALSRAGQMGGEAAAIAASGLVKLLKPRCLAMCGVCAGRPGWTKLGDVIVADRVYRYDSGEEVVIDGVRTFKSDVTTYNLDAGWKQRAEQYDVNAHGTVLRNRPVLLAEQERWVLSELLLGRDPLKSADRQNRCPDWSDVVDNLWKRGEIVDGQMQLTDAGTAEITKWHIKHPDREPVLGLPQVHVGPLGTGNNLQRDDQIFDRLSVGQRLIRGLDMEASAIGLAGHYEDVEYTIVAKGVMDFAEPGRNYRYRTYAARAAAEVLLGFLRKNLEATSRSAADVLSPGTRDLPDNPSPAQLLTARYQAVSWNDEVRKAELKELTTWCDSATAVSIRLFTGSGGSGKTRLFVEWSRRLQERGWDAGFIPEALVDKDSSEHPDVGLLVANERPTFIVVDYAESRTALAAFLKKVTGTSRSSSAPLRIALVAREVGDWYRMIIQQDDDLRDCLEQHDPLRMTDVPIEGELRATVVTDAACRFAQLRGKAMPAIDSISLADSCFDRLLYLHMAALAAVDGLSLTANELLEGIVTHETRFWSRTFGSAQGRTDQQRAAFVQAASRTVAALTILGGAPTVDMAHSLNEVANGPADNAFVTYLKSLYPGTGAADQNDSYLRGLEPDLLGESLVHSVLRDVNTPTTFLTRVCQHASPVAMQSAFTVLGRLGWRHDHDVEQWLRQLLEVDLVNRAISALQAAKALGQESAFAPVAKVLASVLQTNGTTEIAELCEPLLPKVTVALRELATWVSETLLESLDALGRDDVQLVRVHQLSTLGMRLHSLGRHEKAFAATKAAVEMSRRLSNAQRDDFLPVLAMSLNNLGNCLDALGRHDEALTATQEAVEIRWQLALTQPATFLHQLAMSLNNLGNRLDALGRHDEALTATQEAVAIYRRIADAQTEAFLPDLAMSLNNMSNRLNSLGWYEKAFAAAREAVEIYERSVDTLPDAYLPELAGSFTNLGINLNALNRHEKALAATKKSVEIFRRLTEARPDAFLPELAGSLNNLGATLDSLGHRNEALTAMEEAVKIFQRLADSRPDAYLPDLAGSLTNLGIILNAFRRHEEAYNATKVAVEIFGQLMDAEHDAFLPELAKSLNNLGDTLSMLGQHDQAIAVLREAVWYCLTLARKKPQAYLNNLLIVKRNLVEKLLALGRTLESDEVIVAVTQFLQDHQGGEPPNEPS